MSFFVVDVESDGPLLGVNSMVCFGAVRLDDNLDKTFYAQTQPIKVMTPYDAFHFEVEDGEYDPEALAISGFTREEHLKFPHPEKAMKDFASWIEENNTEGKPVLLSDNNGYDASWINWYFHAYNDGKNPFGWSSRRIGDMFCGFYGRANYPWKKHRKTKHTHHPVDDAKGNAEAVLYLKSQGFKM